MNKVLMMKNIFLISVSLILLATLGSCNVHEWPHEVGEKYPFILKMEFESDMPLHKEVYYTRNSGDDSRAPETDYDIRYKIAIYDVADENDNNRFVTDVVTVGQRYVVNHNYQISLNLPEGRYRFRVWCDHVEAGSNVDNFYNTEDFAEIKIKEDNGHKGSEEMRDAFRGTSYGEVYDPELYEARHGKLPANSATVSMQRPMGRYEFLSTDLDEFLDKVIDNIDAEALAKAIEKARSRESDTRDEYWNGLTRDEIAEAIGLDQYSVKFSYNAFMPSAYNLYTDKPSDSLTGVSYESKMQITATGMQMGFDYVLVDDETTMNLNMEVYDKEGIMIASSYGVEVPVKRSKNTVVKGTFLTVKSGGGITINPDFEGDDFNIEIH